MTPLELQVTADISNLQQKMQGAKTSVVNFSSEAGKSVGELKQKLKDLEDARYFETSQPQIKAYNSAIQNTQKEIKALENAGVSGSNAVVKGFGDLYGAVRKVAYALPGVGIGTIFGLLLNPLFDYVHGLIGADEEQKKFNETLQEAGKKGIATGAQLQALIAIASDHTQSLKTRNQALDEANKLMDKHGEKLTLANVATKAITDQTNLYVQALINEAVASKYADRIAELTIKKTEALKKYTEATKQYNEVLDFAKNDRAISGDEGQGFADVANVNASLSKKNDAANSLNSIDNQIKALKVDLLEVEKASTSAFGKLGDQPKEGADRIKKAAETTQDVLSKLKTNLHLLDIEGELFSVDESKNKIREIEAAIKNFVTKFHVAPEDTIIQKLFGDINKINLQEFRDKLKTISKQELKIEVKPPDINNIGKDVKKMLAAAQKVIDDFNKKATESLRSVISSAFEGIGDAIGNAIATGNVSGAIKGFFDGILNSIAGSLKDLGRYLIQTSALLAAAKAAFKSLNPVLQVAAGVGLIALGSLIQSSISNTPKFASGVRNFSGGVALVGERGPELVNLPSGSDVIPNHRLGSIGSQQMVFIPEIKLRGQDLVVVFNRAKQTNARNA